MTTTTFGQRAIDLLESSALDYAATVDGNTIVVHDDVELGTHALATMTFLAFLRSALTQDVKVHWTAQITANNSNSSNGSSTKPAALNTAPLDTGPLHHLPPPTTIAGLPPEHLQAWRSTFRYGLCYFRRGPDFILIKDTRVADVHLTIDHPDLMATFLAACTPLRDDALTAIQREAIDILAAEQLVYRLDGLLLTLPTRMRRWPVPFSAV